METKNPRFLPLYTHNFFHWGNVKKKLLCFFNVTVTCYVYWNKIVTEHFFVCRLWCHWLTSMDAMHWTLTWWFSHIRRIIMVWIRHTHSRHRSMFWSIEKELFLQTESLAIDWELSQHQDGSLWDSRLFPSFSIKLQQGFNTNPTHPDEK